jgi:hypothetical protein|tara:strand:- start:797 stop:1486 length:690 start_codon:yes stop_codon:yes gene_type:complete
MPFAVLTNTTLAIRGAPDVLATGTLFISGPDGVSGNSTLFMAAPPSLAMPLVIGVTKDGSGNATLYTDGVATVDPTASDYQGYATLTIIPTPNASDSSTMSLYLNTHQIGSGINTGPLYLSGTSPLSVNKSADLTVRGMHAVPDSVSGFEGGVSLFIEHNKELSDNMPLHIEKGFNTANTATLYINNRMGSGHLPLVMESTYVSSGIMPLSIKPPQQENVTLYTRGYLE